MFGKKKHSIDGLDGNDLDFDDLGLGDPFGDTDDLGKGQQPVHRLATSFASGAMDAFVQPEQIRRVASNALPEGYGTAVNTAYEVYDTGVGLYHSAAAELRPAMPVFRKAAGLVAEKADRFLPKKVQEKLKDFASRKDDGGLSQQFDADGEAISQSLAEVFGTQMEEQARQRAEDKAEEAIRDRIADKRMEQTARIMDAVRENTERLASYQDTVLSRFQRKSLELSYRSYFAQRDMLKLAVASERRQHLQLDAIMKNTALPEYRKTNLLEAARGSFRERLLERTQQSAVNYVTNFAQNLGKNLTNSVTSALGQVVQSMDMADMAADGVQQGIEMEGGDAKTFAARQAGGMFVPAVTRLLSRPIRRALNKNDRARGTGARLQYTFGNVPERINKWAQSADDNTSIWGGLTRMLKELMPRTGLDPTMGATSIYEAKEATAFDKQTRRSIVEIIPGFLSRIHQELRIIRTKDDSVGLLKYNAERNEFTDESVVDGDMRKRLLHPHRLNHSREQVSTLVDQLQQASGQEFSEEARKQLMHQLLRDTLSGEYFRPDRYTAEESDATELSMAVREELREKMGSAFSKEDGSQNYERLSMFDQLLRELKHSISDPKEQLKAYNELGELSALKRMGLVIQQGTELRVNNNRFFEEIINSRPEDMSPDLDPIDPVGAKKAEPYFAPGVVEGAFGKAIDKVTGRARQARDAVMGAPVVGPAMQGAAGMARDATDAVLDTARDWTVGDGEEETNVGTVTRNLRRNLRRQRRRAKAVGRGIMQSLDEGRKQLVNVYTQGGATATLDLLKLKSGQYLDSATGQVVTRLDQLQGNLTDRFGEVVVDAAQLRDDFYSDHPEVEKQLKVLKKRSEPVTSRVGKWGRRGLNQIRRAARGVGSGLDQAATSAAKNFDRYRQIRSADGTKVMLEQMRLDAGEYQDELTGKTIKRWEDIRGNVVDQHGKLVASWEEIEKGLLDEEGNPPAWLKAVQNAGRRTRVAKRSYGNRARRFMQNLSRDGMSSLAEERDEDGKSVLSADGKLPIIDPERLAAGEYFNEQGQVIESVEEIRGPVFDAKGKPILTARSIGRGLFDRAGRRLRSLEKTLRDAGQKATERVSKGTEGLRNMLGQPESDPAAIASTSDTVATVADDRLVSLGESQVGLLTQIYELLQSKHFGGGGPAPTLEEEISELGEKATGNLRKWGSRVAKSLPGRAARGFGRYVKAVWKAPFQLGGSLLGGARQAGQFGKDYLQDIYVSGTGRLALTAAKMRNGDYLDRETGEPITRLSDIKGAVVNELGEVVLTDEEYSQGLYDSRGGKIIKRSLDILGRTAGHIGKGLGAFYSAPFQAMTFIGRQLSKLNAPEDIYVPGEREPRIRVVDMKAGIVRSKKNPDKVIRKYDDMDGGAIMIKDGKPVEVVSDEEFSAGLVNHKGKPLQGQGSRVRNMLNYGLDTAGKFAKGYIELIGSIYGAGKNAIVGSLKRFGKWFNPKEGFANSEGAATVALLTQIHQVLVDRLPEPKRIRKGSWQERVAANEAEKDKQEAELKEEAQRRDSPLARLFGAIKNGAKGLFGFGGDEEEDEDGGGGTTIIAGGGGGNERGNARDAKGRKRGGVRRKMAARRKGLGRKLGRSGIGRKVGAGIGAARGLGGRVASGAGRFRPRGMGLGGVAAGLAAGAAAPAAAGMLGDTAGGAVETGLTWGGNALTAVSLAKMAGLGGLAAKAGGGLMAAGGMAGTALGGLASGAAALGSAAVATIGLPVLLGAAAVGAIGYLGYKAFKKYKYGSFEPLRAFRMAQYGVNYEDAGQVEKLVEFEQMLEPHTKQMGQGYDISGEELKIEEIFEHFDIDDGWFSNNADERAMFTQWFNYRFKPVYIGWYQKVQELSSGTPINEADEKLTAEQKLQLLSHARQIARNAMDVMEGPFEGERLTMGSEQVDAIHARAKEELEKEIGKDKDKSKGSLASRITSGIMAGMTGGLLGKFAKTTVGAASTMAETGGLLKNDFDNLGGGEGMARSMLRNVAIGVPVLGGLAAMAMRFLPKVNAPITTTDVTALQAIRMKAYGLKVMEPDRVGALMQMEQHLAEEVKFYNDGGANLPGDGGHYVNEFTSLFGVNIDDSGQVAAWVNWFNNRFMPVFLSFASAVRQLDKSRSILEVEQMKPEQKVAIAQALIDAEYKTMFLGRPVWRHTASPWAGDMEPLNDDRDSVKENLRALENQKNNNLMAQETSGEEAGGKRSWWSSFFGKSDDKKKTDSVSQAREEAKRQDQRSPRPKSNTGTAPVSAHRSVMDALDHLPMDHKPAPIVGDAQERQSLLLQEAMNAGISDPKELAMFMAHMAHESNGFKTLQENLNYTPQNMVRIWPNRFKSIADAQALHRLGAPAVIEAIYGGRMGNVEKGDGYKYHGRGFVQLTGRANYEAFAKASGIDVVSNPDLVASDPSVAAKAAVHYWKSRKGLADAARRGDVETTTKLINGGLNGLSDRASYFRRFTHELEDGELGNLVANHLADKRDADAAKQSAQPSTAAAPSAPASGAMSFQFTGGINEPAQTEPVAANDAVVRPTALEIPAAPRPKAPTLNALVMSRPPAATAGQSGTQTRARVQDEVLERQLQIQSEQAAATEARGRIRQQRDAGEMQQVTEVLHSQLQVQMSMDQKMSEVVRLLGEATGAEILGRRKGDSESSTVGASGSSQGESTRERMARLRNAEQRPLNDSTPVPMRRNVRAAS